MSLQKISVFVTALVTVAVSVLAFMTYAQLSETRQMREDIASLQQAAEIEDQSLREEIASLRTEMTELDSSEEIADLQQSISRLRLQSLGVWVDDEPFVSLKLPQHDSPSWWEQYPETVRTITRNDYGSLWPFETTDAILACHGDEILAVVDGGEFVVDSGFSVSHSFLNDIAEISVFDHSSSELQAARERMTEDAQGLCHGKVVR